MCKYCGAELPARRRVSCGGVECKRAAKRDYMRQFNANPDPTRICAEEGCARRHAAHGFCTSHGPNGQRKQKLVPIECAQCGVVTMKQRQADRSNRFCSFKCRGDFQFGKNRRALVHVAVPVLCAVPPDHPSRTQARPLGPRLFVTGPCARCGEPFTIVDQTQARYCSRRCAGRNRSQRHKFKISPFARTAIYERDGWTCQLCMGAVDPDLPHNDLWAATLDHIECQSWALVPDHSPSNLRLAHRWCNSVRNDERYYSTAVLTA